jgi:hypothetical protein
VDPQANSQVLRKAIYQQIINRKKVLPTQRALNKLKQEAQKVY